MPGSFEDGRIPKAVPPLPLPDFEYEDLDNRERVGTGGDADVYRATIDHNGYTYPVAVKEPRFEGTIQKHAAKKFQREAETWSSLSNHNNVVSVYAWGAMPPSWLGLEFMDGGTLNTRIGSLGLAEALWLSGRIAEGIRHGHRHGVAHLDIKPTNVLLRDTPDGKWEYPKVSDWGLAKMLLEHSNSIDGISPTYAAPEQFDAEKYGSPDDSTDIYQLGALVYAMITGDPPFSGPSTAVMKGVLQEDPDPPSTVNSKLPATVDKVVLKALAKRKDDRYESILLFRKDMDQLLEESIASYGDATSPTAASLGDNQTVQTSKGSSDSKGDATGTDGVGTVDTDSQAQSKSTGSKDEFRGEITDPSSDDGLLPVSRRSALGALGASILATGGWMTIQTGGDDSTKPAAATVSTGTPTETSTSTPIEPESETSVEPDNNIPLAQSKWDVVTGEWVFDTDTIRHINEGCGGPPTPGGKAFSSDIRLEDGILSAKIKPLSDGCGNRIGFRYNNIASSPTGYNFATNAVGRTNRTVQLVKSGTQNPILREESIGSLDIDVTVGEYNEYRIEFFGDEIVTYIDDTQIFSITDNSYKRPGKIGLLCGNKTHYKQITYSAE